MLDTEGKRIQAHGAGMIYENGTYYWYGENKEFTTGKDEIWTWGIRIGMIRVVRRSIARSLMCSMILNEKICIL